MSHTSIRIKSRVHLIELLVLSPRLLLCNSYLVQRKRVPYTVVLLLSVLFLRGDARRVLPLVDISHQTFDRGGDAPSTNMADTNTSNFLGASWFSFRTAATQLYDGTEAAVGASNSIRLRMFPKNKKYLKV